MAENEIAADEQRTKTTAKKTPVCRYYKSKAGRHIDSQNVILHLDVSCCLHEVPARLQ